MSMLGSTGQITTCWAPTLSQHVGGESHTYQHARNSFTLALSPSSMLGQIEVNMLDSVWDPSCNVFLLQALYKLIYTYIRSYRVLPRAEPNWCSDGIFNTLRIIFLIFKYILVAAKNSDPKFKRSVTQSLVRQTFTTTLIIASILQSQPSSNQSTWVKVSVVMSSLGYLGASRVHPWRHKP